MKDKKGAGAIVAWVLLMGFAIGLATTVFIWMTRETEEMSESAIKYVEGGLKCENVMINVVKDENCVLTVTNNRYLDIEKVLIRSLDNPSPTPVYCADGAELKVQREGEDNSIVCEELEGGSGKIEVMPMVIINEELVACKNKVITIEC